MAGEPRTKQDKSKAAKVTRLHYLSNSQLHDQSTLVARGLAQFVLFSRTGHACRTPPVLPRRISPSDRNASSEKLFQPRPRTFHPIAPFLLFGTIMLQHNTDPSDNRCKMTGQRTCNCALCAIRNLPITSRNASKGKANKTTETKAACPASSSSCPAPASSAGALSTSSQGPGGRGETE